MLTTNLHVTFSMVWILIVANIISIGIAFLFLKQLARVTFVKGLILVPILLALVWLGAFSSKSSFGDLMSLAVFGFIGFTMVKLDWPRPPLVLGLVLGGLSDKYLNISDSRYTMVEMFIRPVVIIVLLLAVGSLVYALWQANQVSAARGQRGLKVLGWPDVAVTGFLIVLFAGAIVVGQDFDFTSQRFPLALSAVMVSLATVYFIRQAYAKLRPSAIGLASAATGPATIDIGATAEGPELSGQERIAALAQRGDIPGEEARARMINILAWISASFVLLWLFGFREGLPVFVMLFLQFESREKWWISLGTALMVWVVLWQFFGGILHFAWAKPQVAIWLGFDWPGVL